MNRGSVQGPIARPSAPSGLVEHVAGQPFWLGRWWIITFVPFNTRVGQPPENSRTSSCQLYRSTYVVDPRFARYFTAGWTGLLAFFVVLSVPPLYHSIRTGRIWEGIGFWEKAGGYRSLETKPRKERRPDPPSPLSKPMGALRALVHGPTLFSIPKTRLDLGESTSYCHAFISKPHWDFIPS